MALLTNTGLKGDVNDAHRCISIITDGDGLICIAPDPSWQSFTTAKVLHLVFTINN